MNYSKSILLHQDQPEYGLLLKLIVTVVPGAMLVASIYLLSSGDSTDAIALLVEAFVVGLIFWCVFPRKYQVYEDHVRIILGGPFSVSVGFDKIRAIEVTGKLTFGINFVTKFTRNHVEIAKKKGMSINITPRDNDLFVEKAKDAFIQWVNTRQNKS